MSKAIHWKVPFVSTKGVEYEVEIFDSYTGSVPAAWPVTLQAGPVPFTTCENGSDDIFTPFRGSTGTLQVIDPDGTLMESIIPTDNLDKQVRLIRIDNTTTPATRIVDWQGFLNCEIYTQEYTGIAKVLDIGVNSVLETTKSIQLDYATANLKSIRAIVCDICDAMATYMAETNAFDTIGVTYTGANAVDVYIDTTVLFDLKEHNNYNQRLFTPYSKSGEEVLSILGQFWGWVVREQGRTLYLQRVNEEHGMYIMPYANFKSGSMNRLQTLVQKDFDDITWRGIGHTLSIAQGAKSVEVAAEVRPYEIDLKAVECPNHALVPAHIMYRSNAVVAQQKTIRLQGNTDSTFNELREFKCYTGMITTEWDSETDYTRTLQWSGISSVAEFLNNYRNEDSRVNYWQVFNRNYSWYKQMHMAAFLSMELDNQYKPALCICGLDLRSYTSVPDNIGAYYLFRMRSKLVFRANDGNLVLKAKDYIARELGEAQGGTRMRVSLSIGNKYWSGSAWGISFATFFVEIDDDGNAEMRIPMNAQVVGEVDLRVYYEVGGGVVTAVALEELSLSYEHETTAQTDSDTNRYIRILGGNFADEISVGTDIASDFENQFSPSLLQTSAYGKVSTIVYKATGGDYSQRPEEDLIGRLAAHYSAHRRTCKLETEHIGDNIPLTKIADPQGRIYLPIAEERDWQTDTTTITCMES